MTEKTELKEVKVKNKESGATFVVQADEGTLKRLMNDESIEILDNAKSDMEETPKTATKAIPKK